MDAQVVDIRETEREFLADLPPLEPMDVNMVTKTKEILFLLWKRAGQRIQAQSSATLQCARRTLLDVRLAIVHIGGAEAIGRHRCGFWYTSREHSTHHVVRTTQTAP